jgi:hypothetical protein
MVADYAILRSAILLNSRRVASLRGRLIARRSGTTRWNMSAALPAAGCRRAAALHALYPAQIRSHKPELPALSSFS